MFSISTGDISAGYNFKLFGHPISGSVDLGNFTWNL
jgi:hypothetical protein